MSLLVFVTSGCHNRKLIYVRNVDYIFNKKEPIEHMVKINIFYKKHRKRTEIDMIKEKKWNVILGMLIEIKQERDYARMQQELCNTSP